MVRDGVGPAERLVHAPGAEFLRLSPRDVQLGEEKPNRSPPVSMDVTKETETSVPSLVWSVVISAEVKLFGAELPSW